MKFGPVLINVVAEITELWVENSQKINCRDVMSIREGRVIEPKVCQKVGIRRRKSLKIIN